MFPALILGQKLEKTLHGCRVYSHATTRSPIGVLDAEGYPARSGYRIHSFYDNVRATYIYNGAAYDLVLILTDAPNPADDALTDVIGVFSHHGAQRFIEIRGRLNVQHL